MTWYILYRSVTLTLLLASRFSLLSFLYFNLAKLSRMRFIASVSFSSLVA
jgi:hypothetical protein